MSFVGRVVLTKSVIEVVPIYIMMSYALPKESLKETQNMQRNFVWGDTDEDKRLYAFKWSTLTTLKMAGGLGLKNLVINIETCLLKTRLEIYEW